MGGCVELNEVSAGAVPLTERSDLSKPALRTPSPLRQARRLLTVPNLARTVPYRLARNEVTASAWAPDKENTGILTGAHRGRGGSVRQ